MLSHGHQSRDKGSEKIHVTSEESFVNMLMLKKSFAVLFCFTIWYMGDLGEANVSK